MLTVHLAGLPVHTRSLPANKRREFMTSQSDIQWVDLCVFVYVTLLCLSLANLSIQYVNHKHQACPSPCLESCEEFSSTHSPAYSKSHRLCTLNFPLVFVCFWLVVYMFVFVSLWLIIFFVKIYFGFGWWALRDWSVLHDVRLSHSWWDRNSSPKMKTHTYLYVILDLYDVISSMEYWDFKESTHSFSCINNDLMSLKLSSFENNINAP